MPRDIRKVIPVDVAGVILDVAKGGGKNLADIHATLDTVEALLATVIAQTDLVEGNTTGLATNATLVQVRDLVGTLETGVAGVVQEATFTARTPAALRTGRLDAADTYTEMEALADQVGAGAVLTFTFASAVQLVWVRSIGDVSRAVIGSQTPTATLGIYCADDEPTPIVVNGTVVKVFAPAGATKVAVYGSRYT